MISNTENPNFNSELHLKGKKKKKQVPNHTNPSIKIVLAGTNGSLSFTQQ